MRLHFLVHFDEGFGETDLHQHKSKLGRFWASRRIEGDGLGLRVHPGVHPEGQDAPGQGVAHAHIRQNGQ